MTALFSCSVALLQPSAALAQDVELVNIDSLGDQGSAASSPFISSDGRFIVFIGNGLIPGVLGNQVYLRDRLLDITELISQNSSGDEADNAVNLPQNAGGRGVSDDGRYVVFSSTSTNLHPEPNPSNLRHIYVRDRLTADTILISKTNTGDPADGGSSTDVAMAPDGWGVLFNTFASNLGLEDGGVNPSGNNTFLHELSQSTTKTACFDIFGDPVGDCAGLSLSCTGVMAFRSLSPNVAVLDSPSNDIFRGLPLFGTNTALTIPDDPIVGFVTFKAPSISCDGQRVAFSSFYDLSLADQQDGQQEWDAYVFDESFGVTHLVRPFATLAEPQDAVISSSGRWLAFSTTEPLDALDTNTRPDVYAHYYDENTVSSDLRLISQFQGQPSNNTNINPFPTVADSGATAFQSNSTNFIAGGDQNGANQDIFVSGAIGSIFSDGFESGSTSLWSP